MGALSTSAATPASGGAVLTAKPKTNAARIPGEM